MCKGSDLLLLLQTKTILSDTCVLLLGKSLGKLVRLPLSLIPSDAEVRILRGPLRGKKWVKGAGTNACWLGTYEAVRLRDLASAINPGFVVYDVGANVGIYSLVASLRTGPSGAVYSFEPLPRNLLYLHRHLSLNNIQNCVVFEAAVCNTEGTRTFSAAAWHPSMAHLSKDGEMLVTSTTLDSCIYGEKRFRPPNVLKIDVEGAEFEVLEGANRALAEFHPAIFLEVHGTQLHADCCAFLSAKGYRIHESYGQVTATWQSVT